MSLRATDLTFGYGGRLAARRADRAAVRDRRAFTVDGVSLDIAPGALVGVLGPNGSGKTTLLKLLAGALTPQSGRVTLDDVDLHRLHRRTLAQRLAVVPQETYLAFDYSVTELVLMGRYAHLGAFEIEGPDDLAAAALALAATDAAQLADRAFWTLSGGEKQRVAIAAALAQLDVRLAADGGVAPRGDSTTPILCLDEPTASQDLRHQIELSSILARLNASGITIVLTTHDLRFAAAVCRDILLLSTGRVLAQGPAGSVLTPPLVGELYSIPPASAAPYLP